MLHIPILRHGTPYESVEKVALVHHATGAPTPATAQIHAVAAVREAP